MAAPTVFRLMQSPANEVGPISLSDSPNPGKSPVSPPAPQQAELFTANSNKKNNLELMW